MSSAKTLSTIWIQHFGERLRKRNRAAAATAALLVMCALATGCESTGGGSSALETPIQAVAIVSQVALSLLAPGSGGSAGGETVRDSSAESNYGLLPRR